MNRLVRQLRRLRNRANKVLVQVQNSYLRNTRVFGQPFALTLEPTNSCNLKCPLCPTPTRESRLPTGRMKLEEARQIIDSFPYVVFITMSNWGEPFMNPEVFDIIAYAKSRDIEIRCESNFTLFDEERCHKLIDSGLDHLIVALDGNSQGTYEKYRAGGDFETVVRNVEMLKRVQRERNDHRTRVVWKFVVNRYNEHEVDDARAHAERLGCDFEEVTIWTPENQKDDWLPRSTDAMGIRNLEGQPSQCHQLWQSVSVNFNGDVFPCCSEFAPEDRLVNVLDEPFAPAWNGPEYRARRKLNQKSAVNCDLCHKDKDTNWYRTWMSDAQPEPQLEEYEIPRPTRQPGATPVEPSPVAPSRASRDS